MTIETVAQGAGLAPRIFRRHFESVEQCYLIAFDLHARELGEILRAAWDEEAEWPLRVRDAIAAALEFFATSPHSAALLLTEPFIASPAIFRGYQAAQAQLLPYLAEGRTLADWGDSLPELTERALLGSLVSQVGRKASLAEPGKLSEPLPDLTQFVLTPYLGLAEARRNSPN